METDLVKIDWGVVCITERRRRQVFPECLFWVVFNSVQFYLSRQLTQENHGIVEPGGRGDSAYEGGTDARRLA